MTLLWHMPSSPFRNTSHCPFGLPEELFEPEVERYHARIFKLMGDGLLAEFSSVVDAVECAVELQRGLAQRNAAIPEEERISVRIGINIGEVIVEGDDRDGEGVNIATRLEQLAGRAASMSRESQKSDLE